MKVWTATITKKKQQYPGRKLIKRSECQRNIISGVLSSAGFRTVSMSTDYFKPSPAVSSKLDVHSVILKKEFYWQIKNCGHVLRVTSKVTS